MSILKNERNGDGSFYGHFFLAGGAKDMPLAIRIADGSGKVHGAIRVGAVVQSVDMPKGVHHFSENAVHENFLIRDFAVVFRTEAIS